MKTVCAFFAARRYWKDEKALQAAYGDLVGRMDPTWENG